MFLDGYILLPHTFNREMTGNTHKLCSDGIHVIIEVEWIIDISNLLTTSSACTKQADAIIFIIV